jgi:hypothetical protein
MATTTPNYGWTVPTSTDLVKDGATAIETLGDAIDASMNTALGTKKAGMVLLNTTSFSGVSSQSFPDGVISSTYKNYRVIFVAQQNTSTGQTGWRWRIGGADHTSTTYKFGGVISGISSNPTRINLTSQTSYFHNQTTTATNQINYDFVVSRGFDDVLRGFMNSATTNNGDLQTVMLGNDSGSAFDSIKFITSAGTLSGTMSIYGFNF